jgi:dCTP deaminase
MAEQLDGLGVGTIIDSDIIALAGAGELIVDGFARENVRQACYELSASDVFFEPASARENKMIRVTSDEGYLLRPHCYVVAIVKETIRLPADVLGRILTKGQLFSIGILPVNTYADPGFQGRLGITLYNGSHRHIVVKAGQAIAKIECTKLPKAVSNPYSGQHGFETKIWPLPVQHYASSDDLKRAVPKPGSVSEIETSYGPPIGDLALRFAYYEKKVWVQIFLVVGFFAALFALYGQVSWAVSLGVGVAANLVATLGIGLWGRLRGWKT